MTYTVPDWVLDGAVKLGGAGLVLCALALVAAFAGYAWLWLALIWVALAITVLLGTLASAYALGVAE